MQTQNEAMQTRVLVYTSEEVMIRLSMLILIWNDGIIYFQVHSAQQIFDKLFMPILFPLAVFVKNELNE